MSPAAENKLSRRGGRRLIRLLAGIAWTKSASCSALYRNMVANDRLLGATGSRSPAREQDPTRCVDGLRPEGRSLPVRKRLLAILQMLGIFAVAACHNIDDGGQKGESRGQENISQYIPPSVARTVQYRCDDGSQISVDVFDDDRTLFLREEAGFAKLKAEREGAAFSGSGMTFIVTGGTAILSRRGAKAVRCRS
jgi:membrane-bound inhibitor of C-type lysozyme